ncbi:MAG TPA: ABC transporter permease [Pyrinomonadaceae bacterium]|nr:ABC transporter permease [Pyrinomonadaceae bacterium]
MSNILKDLRYAIRGLIRQPAFTVVVVITLALGIGANTAIFSVVYAVLLKPLPFHRADRIVLLWGHDKTAGDTRSQVSHTDISDYRTQQSTFEAISTYSSWTPLMSGGASPERIGAALVGDDFFRVVGTQPQLGRVFLPEEQQDGKDQVVVLSDQLWRQRYNADPAIVGQTILLNLRPHVVVGILPQGFASLPTTLIGKPALLYRPVAESTDEKMRSARHLRAIGRLKDGVSLSQAQADIDVIARRLETEHPESDSNWGIHLVGLQQDYVRDLQRSLWLILGAVAFVLLIACANIANLLLARATLRASEISIRTALGASRWRLLQQSLIESLVLSFVGASVGVVLAIWGIDIIKILGGKMLPQLEAVQLSQPALLFTLGLSLLTALFFGLLPPLQNSQSNLIESLKAHGRSFTTGHFRSRLRAALVVSEIAFALVLLMCAGLLIRSVSRLQKVDPGFDYSQVLKMDLGLPSLRYSTDDKKINFYRELTTRLRSLTGVTSAGVTTPLPANDFDTTGIDIEGQPVQPGLEPSVDRYIVTPGYLEAMHIPLVRGRSLEERDVHDTRQVLLVSKSLADRFWPNQDPIGKRIKLPWNPGRDDDPWREVVGIVGDVKQYGPDKPTSMALYLPLPQYPVSFMTLVVRTQGDPGAMAGALKQVVQSLDPDQVPTDVMTMEQVMADSIQTRRFSMILLGAFAALSLTLAAIGIYGVMSYAVAQRTHELGIRMALGARASNVLALIFRSAVALTLTGVAIGSIGVFTVTRLMKSLLFDTAPTDLTTFFLVSVGLIMVALIACYLPARRATRVDPLVALRNE